MLRDHNEPLIRHFSFELFKSDLKRVVNTILQYKCLIHF